MMSTEDNIYVPTNYLPKENEPYMSPIMRAYFKNKLLAWRKRLEDEEYKAEGAVYEGLGQSSGHVDIAFLEERLKVELLPTINRELTLISQIDSALDRINARTYGYCLATHEPIGVKGLEAWPIAKYSTDVQEKVEKSGIQA